MARNKTQAKKVQAKKVAIVGSASSTKDLAPYDDPDWEIWGLAWHPYKRLDRAFEIHDRALWYGAICGKDDYPTKLAELGCPVYTREVFADIANSVAYPRAEVRAAVLNGREFWASSIGYMVALAIYEGREAVGVWGADMILDEEYGYQRDNLSWLLGIAEGRGIEVVVPEGSALLKCNFVYGDQPPPSDRDGAFTASWLSERKAGYEATTMHLKSDLDRLDGHIAETQDYAGLLRAGETVTIDVVEQRLRVVAERRSQKAGELLQMTGAIAELTSQIDYARHEERGGVVPRKA